jgi:hypothetical protein
MRWAILGIVGVALILILPAMLIGSMVGSAATDAISNALDYEAPASTDQSVVNVCVSIVCKNTTTQTSTATTQRVQPSPEADTSPWAVICMVSGILFATILVALRFFAAED